MLTYEALRKALNDEKTSPALSRLPDNFFEQAREYLEKKASLNKEEMESAEGTLKDLLEIREKKLMIGALWYIRSGSDVKNMRQEEENFFQDLAKALKNWHNLREDLLNSQPKEVVAIIKDLDVFVGLDMENYGPFNSGDVATIPKEQARLLIEKGVARPINIRERPSGSA